MHKLNAMQPVMRAAGHLATTRRAFMMASAVSLLGAAATPVDVPRFAHWIDGTAAVEPEMQVQAVDADTFVIRQSVRTNFEAPFLYLLFGTQRVILLDTGAGGLKVRPSRRLNAGTSVGVLPYHRLAAHHGPLQSRTPHRRDHPDARSRAGARHGL